jgi:hypothetical protein
LTYCGDCNETFICEICENSWCYDCKNPVAIRDITYCNECYNEKEYELYTSIQEEDTKKIKNLMCNYSYKYNYIEKVFEESILNFNVNIIKIILKWRINTGLAITAFIRRRLNGEIENKLVKKLINNVYNKQLLENYMNLLQEQNSNPDIVEYLEYKIMN